MLLGDFYTVSALETEGTSIHATLELNPCHRIFQGHFAGQPVVPGVCMMQLIKELVEASFNRSFRLTKADHLKFLAVIDPRKDPVIKAVISYTVSPPQEINATTSPSQINATAPSVTGNKTWRRFRRRKYM